MQPKRSVTVRKKGKGAVVLNRKMALVSVVASSVALVAFAVFVARTTPPDKNRENWPETFAGNGERLYFTGVSASGSILQPHGGNHHMKMMGSGGCVDCHGTNRKGGRLWPNFWQVAPSITVMELVGDHTQDGHSHEGYNARTLARAITQGIRPDGSSLGMGMPRWAIDDENLGDLVTFLLKH